MEKIISGKDLSKELRNGMKKEVELLKEKYNEIPHLVVVLCGEDPASISYVTAKERACNDIGIKGTLIRKQDNISTDELLELINELNNDDSVHGILVQLPLPKGIDSNIIINSIDFKKDVDGFHLMNTALLHTNSKGIVPCTPKGIITMLKSKNIDICGKNAVIVGRSNLVGKPVAELLLRENATVTICHSRTKNLKSHTINADILIAAVGRPHLIKSDMVKEGAVVIDVGVNRVDKKLVGDVCFDEVKTKASFITPVPGGVGPMTITSLLENTILCYKDILKAKE